MVTLKSGAGYFSRAIYEVKITAPGFEDQFSTINYKLNGWYFGNLLIGGALGMLIIDPLTGGMWKIVDPVINTTLIRSSSTLNSSTPELNIVDIKDIPAELKDHLVKIN